MNDIEKMLRDGISVEDIINEVNKTKTRIAKEEEASKQAELEKAKANAKIAAARTNAINAAMQYMQALGIVLSEADAKELIKITEGYCKELEDEVRALNTFKAKTADMSDDEKITVFLRAIRA